MKYLLSFLVLFTVLTNVSFGQSSTETSSEKINSASTQPIKSWRIAEDSDRHNYEIKLDETVSHSGMRSASIESRKTADDVKRRGSVMQTIRASAYHSKRIRLSAFVKSESVKQASLWFRVDGEDMQVLGLDNMQNRLIRGSTDWSKYELVLDVPVTAQQIVFGASLVGTGQIWIDDLSFEEVSRQIPVTSAKPQDVQAKESNQYIEIYRSKNQELYERQLQRFKERNESAPIVPTNLDFELL